METEEQLKIDLLLGDLRHELAPGIHTYHQCNCGRNNARGGLCWQCLIEDYLNGGNDGEA